MTVQLNVIAGNDKGRSFTIPESQPLLIGRSQTSGTQLNDPRCSKIHCQVEIKDGKVLVTDHGSTGGTFVNGEKVEQKVIAPGDVITVGETQLQIPNEDATLPPGQSNKDVDLTELVGQTVSHFEILEVLAEEPSGVAFKARDTKDDRIVSLKLLSPQLSQNEEEMQRFVRAMKTMMPISHPNLVQLYGAGKTGPYCWVSRELIEGERMTQVIDRIGIANMLDWNYGLRVAVHVARAMEKLSEHQILHRNISPENIFIRTADKVVKLGDTMLAKALEGANAKDITGAGQLVGDIRYMSPERAGGGDVDGRSDIYALGATVYALLTGRPPFEGSSLVETVTKIRTEEPEKPTKFQMSIPGLFEGAVLKMIAKRPEDRYQSPKELLVDLERITTYQGGNID